MLNLRRDSRGTHGFPTNTARWLTLAYAVLIVYVTLHPVSAVRWSQASPLGFVFKPWTLVGITAFDVWTNIAAYLPLGFGLAWIAPSQRWVTRLLTALFVAGGLAFVLESLQSYSPQRVASMLDVVCNTVGAAFGALLAVVFKDRHSALGRWLENCIAPHRGAIWAVIGLWALAQLHPQGWALMTVPLATLTDAWLPSQTTQGLGLILNAVQLRNLEMVSSVVSVSSMLALLRLGLNRHLSVFARVWMLLLCVAALLLWQMLSYWVQYGWGEWRLLASDGVIDAAWVMVGVFVAYAVLPAPWVVVGAVVSLALHTALAQMLPAHPYIASAALWQQGRLAHVYGLTGLVSALWPILALAALVLQSRYLNSDK
jgi:VanZ family protein